MVCFNERWNKGRAASSSVCCEEKVTGAAHVLSLQPGAPQLAETSGRTEAVWHSRRLKALFPVFPVLASSPVTVRPTDLVRLSLTPPPRRRCLYATPLALSRAVCCATMPSAVN